MPFIAEHARCATDTYLFIIVCDFKGVETDFIVAGSPQLEKLVQFLLAEFIMFKIIIQIQLFTT